MKSSSTYYQSWNSWLHAKSFSPSTSDREVVELARQHASRIATLSDTQLRESAAKLQGSRHRDSHGDSPKQVACSTQWLAACLGLACQAIHRTLQVTPYDVQLLAGIAMARGAIAEMQTGEGKTITALLPTVVHALTGRTIHVATVNAYLAKRDYELLSPALHLLGLTTGLSFHQQSRDEKIAAYQANVTFATGYQLGFDYLADQLLLAKQARPQLGDRLLQQLNGQVDPPTLISQAEHAVAIIDEVDSVLLDEGITPLVLSGPSPQSTQVTEPELCVHHHAKRIVDLLICPRDYHVDQRAGKVSLTDTGKHAVRTALEQLQRQDRIVPLHRPWLQTIEAALKAKEIMHRDDDYVIRDGKIELVDEATGRIFADRHWRDGVHQAIEAREGLPISDERTTQASISRQSYFRRYELLCGMTGTARGHEREWLDVFQLPIVVIPTRKPSQRVELPTQYVATTAQKIQLAVQSARRIHEHGRPILVGTRTIELSRQFSMALTTAGIDHRILNGVQDEDEAALIHAAGRAGAVTVATNMAGRGTDIALDDQALAAGGMHVIALERNMSSRIDRQLLGRAGRQGQPGSGQFFVSAQDELLAFVWPANG